MNTIGMTTEQWWEYLDTKPEGDPTEWLNNILEAYQKRYIDYMLAWKAVAEYKALKNEYFSQAHHVYLLIEKREKQEDVGRAIAYKQQLKEKGFSELQADLTIGDLRE
jgi:hypothetical protein